MISLIDYMYNSLMKCSSLVNNKEEIYHVTYKTSLWTAMHKQCERPMNDRAVFYYLLLLYVDTRVGVYKDL
jgi:hypothetical protein